jgi:hypothetical protein
MRERADWAQEERRVRAAAQRSGAARQRASAREPGIPARNERANEQERRIRAAAQRSGAARQRASAREPGIPARNERANEQAQPILSLVVRALVVLAKASGTGYWPSRKYRMAACCSSTGWMLAAVLMPAGLFTALIAAR